MSTGSVEGPADGGGPFGAQDPVSTVLTGANFAVLVVGVLGSLAGARECSSRMIAASAAAVPRRWQVVVSKAVVLAATTAVTAVVGVLGAFWLGMAGESLLSPAATRSLIASFLAQPSKVATAGAPARLRELTERERETVALVAEELTNDDIAERLVISPMTVKTHVNRAMAKLDLRDRAQLVVAAYQSGLVRVGPDTA